MSRYMKVILVAAIAILPLSSLFAQSSFVMVMFDNPTETRLGSFPPDREQYASAISVLKEYGAKAIVMKYFLDQNKSALGDNAFAESLNLLPCFLQAHVDNSEAHPNPIDVKFSIKIANATNKMITGNSGWIPLEQFLKNAYDIGFVDMRKADLVPMFEKYQNSIYKSLWFSILQYALPSLQVDGKYLSNGSKKAVIDEYGEVSVRYPCEDKLDYISFYSIVQRSIDKSSIIGKIILIGYDGNNIGYLDTPIGKIKAHRAFYYCLQNLYDQLQ